MIETIIAEIAKNVGEKAGKTVENKVKETLTKLIQNHKSK